MSLKPTIQRLLRSASGPTSRALMLTFTITIACKVIGFGRELIVAGTYGASPMLDVFLVAIVLPNLFLNAVSGAIGSVIIPRLMALRASEGPAAERRAQQRAIYWTILAMAAASVACALSGKWISLWLSPGFSGEQLRLTQWLLWAIIPYTVVAGVSQVSSLLANAEGRFAVTSAGPGLISIVSGAVLIGTGVATSPWPLVIGLTLGALAELACTGWALRNTRYTLRPVPSRLTSFERSCWSSIWPMSLGALLHTGTLMVTQAMASLAGPGAVSELNYGNRIVVMVASLVGLTVSRVAFPQFSALAAQERFAELRNSIRRFAGLTLAVSVPAMIVLSLGSSWIVEATFRRGQFTADTAVRVGLIQSMFALQLPFYLVGTLMMRAAAAMQMNRMVLLVGSATLALSALLNVLLLGPLGVAGLALATSVVYLSTCGFLWVIMQSRISRRIRAAGASDEFQIADAA